MFTMQQENKRLYPHSFCGDYFPLALAQSESGPAYCVDSLGRSVLTFLSVVLINALTEIL